MLIIKKLRKIGIVIIIILLLLSVIFAIGYKNINSSKDIIDISEHEIEFGHGDEEYGMIYTYYEPNVQKKYDKEYEQMIYSYEIPFSVSSINEEELINISTLEHNSCIFSGGDVWQGTFKNDDMKKTLKNGESTKGSILIDVVPNIEIDERLYDEYEFYYINYQNNVIFKNKYKF